MQFNYENDTDRYYLRDDEGNSIESVDGTLIREAEEKGYSDNLWSSFWHRVLKEHFGAFKVE